MHTIFRNFSCQYSRRLLSILARPSQTKLNLQECCRDALQIWVCEIIETILSNAHLLNKLNKERSEKKMRSTHACTPTFRFSSQYSRRLLSILAQKNINYQKLIQWCVYFEPSLTNTPLLVSWINYAHYFSQRNVDHTFIRFAWVSFI